MKNKMLPLIGIGIFVTSMLSQQLSAAITYGQSSVGSWSYSTQATVAGGMNYFPTEMSQFGVASFVDYVTYGLDYQGQFRINPSASGGFHVFSTWVTSDRDQEIFFINGGDDGHSVFIDGTFLGGAGFGVNVTGNISFQAGVARQLTVVTHNAAGEMHASFHTDIAQSQVLEGVEGITINAVPEPSVIAIVALFPLMLCFRSRRSQ